MLVLARRLGETIVIDGNICVSVVAVKGDRAHLGITAPKDVPVDRQEVYERRFALTTTRTENDILAEARASLQSRRPVMSSGSLPRSP